LGVAFIIALVLITLRSIIRPIGEVITALGASASEVNISAQNMSVYAENLAQSATQQAAAVQESVASMTEMSSMIAQTSDSSIESLTNVRRMAERTQDGNRIMERLASSTEAINQANTQLREMVDIIAEISGKTSVINDIVFKTQLLSFNASIEAARAGQHGRGFAVVAEEFGSLAEISGKAAKEIQSLLETSKKHVHEIVETTHERVSDGLSVSKEALAIFDEISQDTKLITKQIQRISEATREQTIGVHQTSTAMSEMDQAAQQNSLLAGEALRSASGLSEQSRKLAAIMRELLGLVSVYDRGTDSVPTTRPKAAAPKTHIFEVDDDNGSVDLAFLQDAAAKLGKRASLSRKEDPSAENDDVEPYTGRSPR
jgi:methyl-accepting chemotaxis protein